MSNSNPGISKTIKNKVKSKEKTNSNTKQAKKEPESQFTECEHNTDRGPLTEAQMRQNHKSPDNQ